MAATIKPIEAKSVHQIQSGQVIVDLCSVVKELVENALDADANTIEVRFKDYGLDAIEVQDNGTGIAETNYESLALKHYTSKLSTYEDLLELNTFGFRGEALSSLCALSTLSVVTAQAQEAPKGKRLEFEVSGKLKTATIIAAQRGTTVNVENLFSRLPVRQKELSKNIKREYGKVLGLLHAYACISTNVKFIVKNAIPKGRSAVVFSTQGNTSTRDNIANVYGAKMLSQLIELDLKLDLEPTQTSVSSVTTDPTKVDIIGHISKPVFGEGRQTPDRQMFFVNGRPCGLPQIAKAINEVYKSYNVSQSAFIFADLCMDTSSYDVNVSPDKRTIFLHNVGALTDRLKEELTKSFDNAEQTVPQSQLASKKLPSFKQLTVSRQASTENGEVAQNRSLRTISEDPPVVSPSSLKEAQEQSSPDESDLELEPGNNLLKAHFGNVASTREEPQCAERSTISGKIRRSTERQAAKVARIGEQHRRAQAAADERGDMEDSMREDLAHDTSDEDEPSDIHLRDFNARMRENSRNNYAADGNGLEDVRKMGVVKPRAHSQRVQEVGVIPNALANMRSRRMSPEIATITVGDRVITKLVGNSRDDSSSRSSQPSKTKPMVVSQFSQRLRKFDVGNCKGNEELDQEQERSADEHVDEDEENTEAEIVGENLGGRLASDTVEHGTVRDDKAALNHPVDAQRVSVEGDHQTKDETADRTQEEYRVAELIRLAETKGHVSSKERQKWATAALKGGVSKDSTANIVAVTDTDLNSLTQLANRYTDQRGMIETKKEGHTESSTMRGDSEEERLSLTVSKSDFVRMHIAGQFNLGFIIAVRHKHGGDKARQKDELFIIDQHASDEKYNFETLQIETVVGNQRLVHPVMLDLTAVEEEVVLENTDALQQNGFVVESDTTGYLPVGQRCKLLSLPLSKEVTFSTKDLDELIHLLSEAHISSDSTYIPRPSKVRKMFAMRACRSSIMIGKTLSMRQMRNVLEHMGRIDKPWNCPHGRPTMRHLTSLDAMDSQLWTEGDGLVSDDREDVGGKVSVTWKAYIA